MIARRQSATEPPVAASPYDGLPGWPTLTSRSRLFVGALHISTKSRANSQRSPLSSIPVRQIGRQWFNYAIKCADQALACSGPPKESALPPSPSPAWRRERQFRGNAVQAAMFKISVERKNPPERPCSAAFENIRYIHLNGPSISGVHSNDENIYT